MLIARIENCTRVLGKAQGFLGLPIRDDLISERVLGDNVPCMTTAWEPTPDELSALNAGAKVQLRVVGTQHPPVMLEVGPVS